jgi:hypothetical protein
MRFGASHFAAFALLAIAGGSAEGQYLHGRVTDRQSGDGVPSASVLVINSDNSIRSGAITDREGHFTLRTTPGTFRLRIERAGYATIGSTPLELARTDTVGFEIRLSLRPVEIDSLTVVAAAGAPRDPSGFFRRQTGSAGRFLGPYEVERRHPNSPADLLHDIPGFQINPRPGGNRVLVTGRNRRCEPTVYIDGLLAHRGTQTNRLLPTDNDDGVVLESLVNANAIRALEAYPIGSLAPARFRPVGPIGGGDCAVIVFWTRTGLGR